ncbi:MAG: hypothetical protein CMM92_04075 [Rickettsiales bacterium]|nr:hypothetical protein [Rickettsiales bacterium]RPG14083.1 MAG: hypothetical protein CBD55_004060 [Pelagibacteraceae bacterium TMED195]|tara:strand:+ start:1988 stop:2506 length:519 start_codon:yes stop_codon:yes gene_type:complete
MISEYLKKYSYYYLTRYSVTKKKFENILKRKISKDYFQKKISTEEKNKYISEIPEIVDHHKKNGCFNEKNLIDLKINSLIEKGYSLKKIKISLIKLCFNKEILDTKMSSLYSNERLNYDLMENFFNRSKIFINNAQKKNDFKKILNKFINMGFEYNESLDYLKQKLNFYDHP